MKVLKITSWYPNEISPLLGSFVEDQAQALMKNGIDVGVLYVDMDLRNIFKKLKTHHFKSIFKMEEGIKVFRYYGFFFPKIIFPIYKKWVLFFDILFKKYVQKFGLPDVLHAHNYQSAYAASFLSKKYNIPFLVTEHSSQLLQTGISGWRLKTLQSSFNEASYIISVSKGLKKLLKTYISKNIEVIPNLIDTKLFSFGQKTKENKIVQFISVGDLITRKGYHFLIEAFSKIKPSIKKNIKLKIIGGEPEYEQLKKLIFKYNEVDNIILMGECPRDVVALNLQASDIFILASSFETFGIVVIEAMSTGLPVISTKCYGPEDILTPQTGILIPTENVSELVQAMEKMFFEYIHYDSEYIRKYVLDNYTEKVITQKIIHLYQLAIQEKID